MFLAGARQVALPQKLTPIVDVVLWNLVDNGYRIIAPDGSVANGEIFAQGAPDLKLALCVASLKDGL